MSWRKLTDKNSKEWQCARCGHVNRNNRPVCSNCGIDRDESNQLREKNWNRRK